jgi:hypothetical protein
MQGDKDIHFCFKCSLAAKSNSKLASIINDYKSPYL